MAEPFSGIEFEGTLQRSGVLLLPKSVPIGIAVEVDVDGLRCVVLTRTRAGNATQVKIPIQARDDVRELPLRARVRVSPTTFGDAASRGSLVPRGLTASFAIEIGEHKRSMMMTVPLPWVRGLVAAGWLDIDVEVRNAAVDIQFPARVTPNRAGVLVCNIPARLAVGLTKGDRVDVVLRRHDAASTSPGPFIEDGVLRWDRAQISTPTRIDGGMVVPVTAWMSTPWRTTTTLTDDLAWLLGFYCAEGAKSGLVFTLSQKSARFVKRAADALKESFGFAVAHLKLTVIYGRVSERSAVAVYKDCNVPIVSTRLSSGEGVAQHEYSAILDVRDSKPFVQAILWGIDQIVTGDVELPLRAKQMFLLGYLDGDGTVTMNSSTMLRVAAASEREARLLERISADVFERGISGTVSKRHQDDLHASYDRSLTARDMLWLIQENAFSVTLSRPRLFHALHGIIDPLLAGDVVDHRRWRGMTEEDVREIAVALAMHDREWAFIRSRYPTDDSVTTGTKVLYEYDPS